MSPAEPIPPHGRPEPPLPADFDWLRGPLLPIGMLVVFGAVLALAAARPSWWHAPWALWVPTAEILLIVVVMLWPMAGVRRYLAYKRPLFIASIAFELWIVFGGLALILPDGLLARDLWFQIFLGSFFLLTAICSLPGVGGEYRRGLFFRPDFLFGNGCYLARGEIFVALGVKLLLVPSPAHPIWNWWGLSWAVIAMVALVPLRGVVKLRLQRARLLGLGGWTGAGMGLGQWLKEAYLYVGLLMLIYGFANVYMGLVPFTWYPGEPMHRAGPDGWGLLVLALSAVLLIPVRGWYKTRIPQPASFGQELFKNLLLWLGFVPLVYGFLIFFMGVPQPLVSGAGTFNFSWSLWVTALGFLMVVPLRTLSQREEFRSFMAFMVARLADLDDQRRASALRRRLGVLAALPERAQVESLGQMMQLIHALPEDERLRMVRTRAEVVAALPNAARGRLLRGMANAFARLPEAERVPIMAEVMGGVAELPEAQRRLLLGEMTALLM